MFRGLLREVMLVPGSVPLRIFSIAFEIEPRNSSPSPARRYSYQSAVDSNSSAAAGCTLTRAISVFDFPSSLGL